MVPPCGDFNADDAGDDKEEEGEDREDEGATATILASWTGDTLFTFLWESLLLSLSEIKEHISFRNPQ